jgi:hypothetical protein
MVAYAVWLMVVAWPIAQSGQFPTDRDPSSLIGMAMPDDTR